MKRNDLAVGHEYAISVRFRGPLVRGLYLGETPRAAAYLPQPLRFAVQNEGVPVGLPSSKRFDIPLGSRQMFSNPNDWTGVRVRSADVHQSWASYAPVAAAAKSVQHAADRERDRIANLLHDSGVSEFTILIEPGASPKATIKMSGDELEALIERLAARHTPVAGRR